MKPPISLSLTSVGVQGFSFDYEVVSYNLSAAEGSIVTGMIWHEMAFNPNRCSIICKNNLK